MCFPVNIANFLRTPILKKHLQTAASDTNLYPETYLGPEQISAGFFSAKLGNRFQR